MSTPEKKLEIRSLYNDPPLGTRPWYVNDYFILAERHQELLEMYGVWKRKPRGLLWRDRKRDLDGVFEALEELIGLFQRYSNKVKGTLINELNALYKPEHGIPCTYLRSNDRLREMAETRAKASDNAVADRYFFLSEIERHRRQLEDELEVMREAVEESIWEMGERKEQQLKREREMMNGDSAERRAFLLDQR
ncbi:hypothetical protein FKW77_001352 [Venturia effusa]|uniref:Uncharacterized protein n=1 Tax=Venturia effusa TaxID=50376 RepID=A0A517LQT3_9PEZI|nr:hypothetical protein FKW77_001352 [Venturia effusa]